MIGHIAYAEGAPCPTLVLDGSLLPDDDDELVQVLHAVRRGLVESGAGSVLKIALIFGSAHPFFDLEYRFVQVLPGGPGEGPGERGAASILPRFDLRGSCGHSILAAVVVASRLGWLRPLAPGDRARVRVLNNGDDVVCEVEQASLHGAHFTAHFLRQPPSRLGDLLLTGAPCTELAIAGERVPVSLISAGNPYVFVDAASLGVTSQAALLSGGRELFERMLAVRAAARKLLGWPDGGAFPKVAAVGQFSPGRVAARAISVPGWHPTLALTGKVCLGAASAIAGTIPYLLAKRAGGPNGELSIDTPGGLARVRCETSGATKDSELRWVSVAGKPVRFLGDTTFGSLAHLMLKESTACLSLPA